MGSMEVLGIVNRANQKSKRLKRKDFYNEVVNDVCISPQNGIYFMRFPLFSTFMKSDLSEETIEILSKLKLLG